MAQTDTEPFEDAYEPDSLYAVRNAIKIDPVQIVFGDFELFYERIIAKGFSVEIGGGITRRNYAAGLVDYSLDNLGRNVAIKTGYSYSIALRKYLKQSDELFGPYLGLGWNGRKYLTDYSVIDTTGELTGDTFRDQRPSTAIFIMGGYSALPLFSNIFVDFYLGVGVRMKDYEVVRANDINDPDTYFLETKKSNDFAVQAGVKFGFGF